MQKMMALYRKYLLSTAGIDWQYELNARVVGVNVRSCRLYFTVHYIIACCLSWQARGNCWVLTYVSEWSCLWRGNVWRGNMPRGDVLHSLLENT